MNCEQTSSLNFSGLTTYNIYWCKYWYKTSKDFEALSLLTNLKFLNLEFDFKFIEKTDFIKLVCSIEKLQNLESLLIKIYSRVDCRGHEYVTNIGMLQIGEGWDMKNIVNCENLNNVEN